MSHHGSRTNRAANPVALTSTFYYHQDEVTLSRIAQVIGVGMNSHNHIMFGSMDAWLYRTLYGIIPQTAAWREVQIEPWVPPDMALAAGALETVRGRLTVFWQRVARCVRVRV